MNITVEPVKRDEKEILRNLLEKYLYEFSQYDDKDVNAIGLYGYDYLDVYWTEEKRFPFFIKADGRLAGFVMINDYQEIKIKTDYSMAEFFVLHKYRRRGVGKFALKQIFDTFKGKWQLMYHPKNESSMIFWTKMVDEYTKGKYELIKDDPKAVYDDGTAGHVLLFETCQPK